MPEEKKIDWEHRDVKIERKGTQITLPSKPEPMPIPDAISALARLQEDEEQEIDCIEPIEGFPLDAAVAFMKAMQRTFGWASPRPTPGFFGPQPPRMFGVSISPTETVQVALGRFAVPGLAGNMNTQISDGKFYIIGNVQKRHAYIVKELAKLTREIVSTESIYKGKALRFKTNSKGKVDYEIPPTFINTSDVRLEELILSQSVEEMVTTAIFTPVRHTEKCRSAQIPLNRGVLLEGTYGTGKTMVARCTAKVCEENGWTFILLDKAQGLKDGLLFARRYAPAVVFCEDIDRVTGERDEEANDLLNTIDGILTKDSEVIAVMTTNHVETINQAMLRPGRLDSVISVTPPNSEAVKKLIYVYARGLLDESVTLDRIGKELAGQIPATIREVVERSKLRAIPKMNGHGLVVKEDDLLAAAMEMKVHLALLNKPKDTEHTGAAKMLIGFQEMLNDTDFAASMRDKVGYIEEWCAERD